MTFASEEVRTTFHTLSTQTQYDWANIEELLAQMGYALFVEAAPEGAPHCLEVRVRIYEKTNRAPFKG